MYYMDMMPIPSSFSEHLQTSKIRTGPQDPER
jgi:hypothetical protein